MPSVTSTFAADNAAVCSVCGNLWTQRAVYCCVLSTCELDAVWSYTTP